MTREVTEQILEDIENGILDRDTVIMSCLKYMSEDDVADMAHINELLPADEDEDDYEDDGQPSEFDEWMDFDPDC
jgi:hypothetical protein